MVANPGKPVTVPNCPVATILLGPRGAKAGTFPDDGGSELRPSEACRAPYRSSAVGLTAIADARDFHGIAEVAENDAVVLGAKAVVGGSGELAIGIAIGYY
jgi:hypothetical protein